ncbi:hypothetical protein AMTRI_Chr10g1190 [Amborella trichopoda]|uniref:Uncharacterized protein n=1 Tax=Amborella trichopoda TaxID=13333 RepID=W1PFV1_AMBTC|nr:hypothetical protein AMTR_s00058p00082460 [Amborella trichopoda]
MPNEYKLGTSLFWYELLDSCMDLNTHTLSLHGFEYLIFPTRIVMVAEFGKVRRTACYLPYTLLGMSEFFICQDENVSVAKFQERINVTVDVVGMGLPKPLIKTPMDLSHHSLYSTPPEFAADTRLTFHKPRT